jgi:hypothetical protein
MSDTLTASNERSNLSIEKDEQPQDCLIIIQEIERQGEKDVAEAKKKGDTELLKRKKELDEQLRQEIEGCKEAGRNDILKFKEKRVENYKIEISKIKDKVAMLSERAEGNLSEAVKKIVDIAIQ